MAAAATTAAGGLALAVSAFLPWISRGAGSSMSLRDIADFVLGDGWSTIPGWLGAVAYAVPVCGGLAIIGAGLPLTAGRRVLIPAAAVAGMLLAITGIGLAVRTQWPAAGFVVAVLGEVALFAGIRAPGDVGSP